jgi:hypothetical protein
MAETAAADASRTRQGMASVARLQDERYENLRGVLQEVHKSIGAIFRGFTKVSGETQLEVEAITYITLETARFVKLHDTIQQLELGIEDLVHGQLTPRLVGAGSLKETLANISRTLGKRAYELSQKTPEEMYVGGNFDFTRKGHDLYGMFRLPYSRGKRMGVCRLHVFPVLVPGKQRVVTEFSRMPSHVLVSDWGVVGELLTEPRLPIIETENIRLYRPSDNWCLLHLGQDRPEGVAQSCEFSVRREPIQPSYLKLAEGKYVVSNLTKVHTRCEERPHQPAGPCVPCLVTLGCGCSLVAYETSITNNVLEEVDCGVHNWSKEIMYAVNLAVLQSFYDLANATVSDKTLTPLNKLQEAQRLDLPLFRREVDKWLAADKAVSYSLKKVVEGLQNDTVILHTPAEAVLKEFLAGTYERPRFQWRDWYSWITLLPLMAIPVLAVIQYKQFVRLRAITAISAIGMSLLPKAHVYATLTPPHLLP